MVCNSVGIMHFKFLEFNLEDLIACRAGILEPTMFLVRDRMHVRQHLTQGALAAVGYGMLGTSEPAKEVGRTVVERIGDEMMTDADFAGCRVDRTISEESKRHENVAGFVYSYVQNRIQFTRFSCFVLLNRKLHGRTEFVRDFLSLRIKKVAVGMCPTDDVFCVLEWYLFASLVEEPDAR